MNLAEKLETVAKNQQLVYDKGLERGAVNGRAEERAEFWNVYQSNGKKDHYMYAFAGGHWRDSIYNPTYPIVVIDNGNYMFSGSSITNTKVPIDISGLNANAVNMFASSAIETIPLLIVSDNSAALTTAFTSCNKLANLTIQGTIAKNANFQWCPLTRESIESVINALSTDVAGTTATFKASVVNTIFETNTGAGDGSESAGWMDLIAQKSNWTISLV